MGEKGMKRYCEKVGVECGYSWEAVRKHNAWIGVPSKECVQCLTLCNIKPKEASVCEDCKGCENTQVTKQGKCIFIHEDTPGLIERCPWPSRRVDKRPKIKPCPFCGAKAKWESALMFSVEHNGACVFSIYTMHQKTEHAKYVLSSWNHRAAS